MKKRHTNRAHRSLPQKGKQSRHDDLQCHRYSCVLLFRFEVGKPVKRHGALLHEFRICVITERTPQNARRAAITHGRKRQYHYINTDGQPVRFRFVRVVDCLELTDVTDESQNEVWYDQVLARPTDVCPSRVKRLPLRQFIIDKTRKRCRDPL